MHGASMQATKEAEGEVKKDVKEEEEKKEEEGGAESNVSVVKTHKVAEGDAEAPFEALGLDNLLLHIGQCVRSQPPGHRYIGQCARSQPPAA